MIKLEERDTIAGDNTDYITNVDLGSDDSLLDGNKAEDLIKLKNRYVPGTCTSIINYYPGYVLK